MTFEEPSLNFLVKNKKMPRVIVVTESQLKSIVDNQINEQHMAAPIVNAVQTQRAISKHKETQLNEAKKKYPCINDDFVISYQYLLEQKKYNEKILKIALSIIGRESTFASGKRYNVTNVVKRLASMVGLDTSVGPAQMKSSTAEEFGIDLNTLTTNTGALDAAYRYVDKNYGLAKSRGYVPNRPSNLGVKGTGDGALDIAIASYNAGLKIIAPWCKTTNPKICVLCSNVTQGAKIPVPNYIPNYRTERADQVNTTTRGYVTEVAGHYKKMTC